MQPDGTNERAMTVTRRHAIAGGGLVALLGTGIGISHFLRPASAVQPDVPVDALQEDGWVEGESSTEVVLEDSAGPVTIRAVAATVQYQNRRLVDQVRNTEVMIDYMGQSTTQPLGDYLDGELNQPLGVFSATKIDVTPHLDELPAGLGQAEVMDPLRAQAQSEFEQQLETAGLDDIRQVRTDTIDIDTGQAAEYFEYTAAYRIEETSTTVQGVELTIP
ncbi:MAG: hypothetical protein ABEH64_08985 [Salinirussus sp.]